jgi:sporulation integral membrane protein YlbJ
MRFHARDKAMTPVQEKHSGNRFYRGLQAMHRARLADGRPIGQMLGEAVSSAVQTLLMIGGFVIIFSVLIHVFTYVGITGLLASLLSPLLQLFHLSDFLAIPFVAGILEMTIGSQLISEYTTNVSLLWQLAFVSLFLGWNGLSIHAQVASVLSKSDIRYRPYLISRVLHAVLAFGLTFVCWDMFQPKPIPIEPVFVIQSGTLPAVTLHSWLWLQLLSMLIIASWLLFLIKRYIQKFTI